MLRRPNERGLSHELAYGRGRMSYDVLPIALFEEN